MTPAKVARLALLAGWIFVLAVGLAGSAFMAFLSPQAGNVSGAILWVLFIGVCVYLYPTCKIRNDIWRGREASGHRGL